MTAKSELPEITHLASVGSTNDAARELASAGAPHGAAVRADVQLEGRGRRGHAWTSPAGGLYLSIVLRPGVPQHVMCGLPAACGIGAARGLSAVGAAGVRIKWPNDLVAGPAGMGKLGGLLTEAGWADGGIFAVCGVGVNVDVPHVASPSPRALEPMGLEACLPAGAPVPDLPQLARAVRDGVVAEVDRWAAAVLAAGPSATPLTGIMDDYYDLLAYMGEQVALIDREGAPLTGGVLTGVDAWGRALVTVAGRERPFDAAMASLRPVG